MSQQNVIARPYAKAIFEHALNVKALKDWAEYLEILAFVVLDATAVDFLTNPIVTLTQQTELLLSPFSTSLKERGPLEAWIKTLVAQRRIFVLPAIYLQYQNLRADHEKTLGVEIFSFLPLTDKQQLALKDKLSKKLKRDVSIEIMVDPSLLGGVVIRAGDYVLDGSVKGKLSSMQQELLV